MSFASYESPMQVSDVGLPIEPGFAQPYPYSDLMRQFDGGKCRHRGLDIGAAYHSPNMGMGGVINAVVKSQITLIGKTGVNTAEYGRLDTRTGTAKRTGRNYPRQVLAPGYGLVYPFSRSYGRWRSGNVIVTKVVSGPLKGYIIRYMHLGAIRPDLTVGRVVEAGEHIALMGGTAVMDSYPHLHLDMEMPDGKTRVDLAPYIGLPDTSVNCGVHHPVLRAEPRDEAEQPAPADDASPQMRVLERQPME